MNFNIRDKVVSYLNLVTNSMSNLKSPVMWVVMLYAIIIAIGIVIYLVAWVYLAYFGKIDLKSLLDFIHELVSSPFVLCITFIGGCLIDMNQNGVPDSIENKLDSRLSSNRLNTSFSVSESKNSIDLSELDADTLKIVEKK